MVPFRRAFPAELILHIVTLADTQTISRTARTSFGCYELAMPVLLDALTFDVELGPECKIERFFRQSDSVSCLVAKPIHSDP